MDDVSRTHSPALAVAGLALAASMLIRGFYVSYLQRLNVVGGCAALVLVVVGHALTRSPPPEPRRWLAPRELVRACRRYARRSPWRRLLVGVGTIFVLLSLVR